MGSERQKSENFPNQPSKYSPEEIAAFREKVEKLAGEGSVTYQGLLNADNERILAAMEAYLIASEHPVVRKTITLIESRNRK